MEDRFDGKEENKDQPTFSNYRTRNLPAQQLQTLHVVIICSFGAPLVQEHGSFRRDIYSHMVYQPYKWNRRNFFSFLVQTFLIEAVLPSHLVHLSCVNQTNDSAIFLQTINAPFWKG